MELTINNQRLEFSQYKDISDGSPTDNWFAKPSIHGKEVVFELYGACWNCGMTKDRAIDWEGVKQFLEHYTLHHKEKVEIAKKHLNYLIRAIGWWSEEDISTGDFWLTGVTLKSFLENSLFEGYTYDLYFYFNGPVERYYQDVYGLWIVSFQGKHLLGMRREQV